MFDFQKLDVYKKAKVFHVSCKKLILKNKFDRYVNDQLGRASFSVPLNIAEGSGKFSKKDRKNYFITARASVFECVAVLDILSDENNITNKEHGYYKRIITLKIRALINNFQSNILIKKNINRVLL